MVAEGTSGFSFLKRESFSPYVPDVRGFRFVLDDRYSATGNSAGLRMHSTFQLNRPKANRFHINHRRFTLGENSSLFPGYRLVDVRKVSIMSRHWA